MAARWIGRGLPGHGWEAQTARLLGFGLVTLALGLVSRTGAFGPEQAVAYAAPAAWGAAVLVRVRRGPWPAYTVMFLLATLALGLLAGEPWKVAACYGLANVCQALAFAGLVSRCCPGVVRLDQLRRVGELLLAAMAVSALAGAVLAVGLAVAARQSFGIVG